MADTIIPLADLRYAARMPTLPLVAAPPTGLLGDTLGRPLRDLRISVTDRCNFRCSYCMPKEVFDKSYSFLPHSSLLNFEEIARLARLFVAHGVKKIRLTGGEPLLRKNIEVLVAMLAALRGPTDAPLDLTMTTNGSLLARKAKALKEAGLNRVTVSLDALDDAIFRRMNDADFPVADVLNGIAEAERVGLGPVKVNMVVKRGTNDTQILPMARHFKGSGVVLRFIEYMDVGATNGWRMDEVLPSAEVVEQIAAELPLLVAQPTVLGETAQRWRYADGSGEIGVISSVTQAFCHDCNRARLSTEGKLFLCLFASHGHDLRALLRGGYSDAQVLGAIGLIWQGRADRYSELRGSAPAVSTATAPPRGGSRCTTSAVDLAQDVAPVGLIRRLEETQLDAYKRLRDRSLEDYPEAFSSDAEETARQGAASYRDRLGSDRPEGGHFTLAAFRDANDIELAGAVSCDRETRRKAQHIGHLTAMMVRRDCIGQGVGRALLAAAIAEARHATGLEMLTLSVTASNLAAVRLYERAGFVRYATLPNALKVEGRSLTKDGMVLRL